MNARDTINPFLVAMADGTYRYGKYAIEQGRHGFDAAHGLNTAEYALWEVDQALARLGAFPDDALREQLGGLIDTARAIAKIAGRAGR